MRVGDEAGARLALWVLCAARPTPCSPEAPLPGCQISCRLRSRPIQAPPDRAADPPSARLAPECPPGATPPHPLTCPTFHLPVPVEPHDLLAGHGAHELDEAALRGRVRVPAVPHLRPEGRGRARANCVVCTPARTDVPWTPRPRAARRRRAGCRPRAWAHGSAALRPGNNRQHSEDPPVHKPRTARSRRPRRPHLPQCCVGRCCARPPDPWSLAVLGWLSSSSAPAAVSGAAGPAEQGCAGLQGCFARQLCSGAVDQTLGDRRGFWPAWKAVGCPLERRQSRSLREELKVLDGWRGVAKQTAVRWARTRPASAR